MEPRQWLREDAGKALTEHPDIKAIGFVGESRTGSLIMKQGADTLKRVHFELGGKNRWSSLPMPIWSALSMPPSS